MDKNKNSSDLLAAGHKKLKQFRPEKDGKGSSSQGNSSKKTNKSEQHESDADAADTVAKPTALLHVSEGETTGGDLTVSRSTESSLPSGLADAAFISPVEPIVSEETGNTTTVAAHDAGLPVEVGTVGECDVDFSVPNGRQSTQTFDSMTSTEIHSSTADIPFFEGETKHDDVPHPSASVDTKEVTVVKLDLASANKEMGQNSLLTMDDFPNIYLSQAREDQITDVCNRGHEFGSKVTELTEVEEKIHQLDALRLQQEFEILTLKESSRQKEEALQTAHSELLKKISELEQSEQRVSSVREKLSIAVAKGKGLVVQRDGLKQSLAETSAELERFSQELQVKDSQLQELEIKLKTYMEAGERVEALESELSYIRNSATALRESFLLKDSVLQRIEEILEDLDLPDHFHSRDIIEKVDWLARSTSGNSLPAPDWNQKSSVGGSYSDAGFVTVDTWKEVAEPTATLGDDSRRKYEDLESKFYVLAEQNEMLEQSLMERNHLVQRWEELLDRIDMPSQLRSMEPVEKIEWLGGALSEANHEKISLQKKIDDLENYLESVASDLEESEKRISDLEANLQSAALKREHLSGRLDVLTSDHHNLAAKAARFELENEKLQIQVSGLLEELDKKIKEDENLLKMEVEIRRLQHLVCDVLHDPEANDLVSDGSSTASLEGLVKKLIENYTNLKSMDPKPVDIEIDPVEKLGQIGKVCHDLHAGVASSNQESQKSKRAAELLLAEVNEVQERNDGLQDRDDAEAAKLEVLSRLEELSTVHSEGKRKQYSELMVLQSNVNELTEGINDIHNLLYNVFQKDLEFLHNLEVNIKSCFEGDDGQDVVCLPNSFSSNLEDKVNFQSMHTSSVANMQEPIDDNAIVEVCGSIWHHLQDLTTEITALKEKLIVHSKSFHEQGCSIWNVLGILHKEKNCHKESFDAMRRNIMHIESIGKEKDVEIVVLRRNIALLYEACANAVMKIENRKAELLGNSLSTADLELADGGLVLGEQNSVFSDEHIKTIADKLLSTMKDFSSMIAEIAEGSQREMKITVANLQKEFQEKDIQKDQICMELVGQIKSAEAAAMNLLSSSRIEPNLLMDQGRGRGTLLLRPTSKKENGLGKEKRVTFSSKPNASITNGQRRPSSGSTDQKQVANHLNKSTKSTSSQVVTAATRNVKRTGADQTSQSQRPNTLRRSFSSKSSTTTAPPVRKPITSPAPPRKPTIIRSASFSSISTTGAPKSTLATIAKNTIAGKPSTLSSSSSSMTRTRSFKKTPTLCPATKRGTTTSASKRTPITTRGKKEVQHLEAKHENKENLDHQVEEVAKHGDKELPNADKETQQHAHVVDVDTTIQVKSSVELGFKKHEAHRNVKKSLEPRREAQSKTRAFCKLGTHK